ncbi:MAG: hypothetical protein NXI16_04835 [Alphaproteobacteria bacterium]|nr:hypothetical protein [Alphaproteobacteria bacterium]
MEQRPGKVCKTFIDFYDRLRRGGDCPHQGRFDVLDVIGVSADVVPHLWTVSVHHGPRRLQYGVLGGAIIASGPAARSGGFIDELHPDAEDGVAFLHRAIDDRALGYRRGVPLFAHEEEIAEIETAVAPFRDDLGAVAKLVCCTVFYWKDAFDPIKTL